MSPSSQSSASRTAVLTALSLIVAIVLDLALLAVAVRTLLA
ncbi:hypothetical protein [Streptomyces sp. BA2]|nr:hypothetical protein [Streptomyces sp. BA2]